MLVVAGQLPTGLNVICGKLFEMKALVTGGAGFIGSNLVKHLVAEGHEVTVLDNLTSGLESNLVRSDRIEFVRGDVRDESAIDRAVRGRQVIFHMAASVGNKRSIDSP